MFFLEQRRAVALVAGLIGTLVLAHCGADADPLATPFEPTGEAGVDGQSPHGSADAGDAAMPTVIGLDARPVNTTCRAFTAPPPSGAIRLVNRFPGITKIIAPTGMFQRPGDNARWYVTERGGRIWTFPNTPGVTNADVTEVLDMVDVTWGELPGNPVGKAWDCSMSAIAFPPDFAASKRAYVSYCYYGPETDNHLQIRVSRFATNDGGLTLDRASEQLVVALDHPDDAAHAAVGLHAGNVMRFGKDGYLYYAIGDGGPQGAGGGAQAQDRKDVRGTLVRLDVSDLSKSLSKDYVSNRRRLAVDFPADNPFVDSSDPQEKAIYAYGFRNPWQFHFDRKDGSIWLGDVGNETWEEVDARVAKGGNYGWSVFEGFDCTFHAPLRCLETGFKKPLLTYRHGNGPQEGNAVTGGLVYRGAAVPSLTGSYVFGDSARQHIWAVRNVDTIPASPAPGKELIFDGTPVSSFAEDQDGELFATTLFPTGSYPGWFWAIEETPPSSGGDAGTNGPPDLLSKTGCFEPTDAKTPLPALVPYEPSAELYSDNATKRRWLALPEGATIGLGADGDFEFPNGSVLVKEFSVDDKRVETRFFVRQDADGRWAAYTYKWKADQSDATLVGAAGDSLALADQTWHYPSRAQCQMCHTRVAGTTLGLEIAQLNHPMRYGATGRTANQLETLHAVGMLPAPGAVASLPNLAGIDASDRTLEERARGYLHANCANCHRPEGPTFTPLDFRFGTTLDKAGICDELPTIADLSDKIPANPRLLSPGSPEKSVIWWRLSTTDATIRMPPVGRTLTHPAGSQVISDWIKATTVCP